MKVDPHTAKHRADKSAHPGAAGNLHKDQTAAAPDAAKKPTQPGTTGSGDPAKKL